MTALVESDESVDGRTAMSLVGQPGQAGTRLLAGPTRDCGAESLAAHYARLGGLPASLEIDELTASGLTGRGGGNFPLARKMQLAASRAGTPLVVVNASESEPASRKDVTLLELRPHLVLDGAVLAARTLGTTQVVVYLHAARTRSTNSLMVAVAERREAGWDGAVTLTVVDAPQAYLSGESSALVSVLEGRGPVPSLRPAPVAASGVGGRPTLVSNTETYAHVGLIARFGATWFRTGGPGHSPGSTLVTMAGGVAQPGLVAEAVGEPLLRDVLTGPGGLTEPPRAVLLGGYAGSWLNGETAWSLPLDRGWLAAAGTSLGCGLVAVLDRSACGLAETVRLLDYLAGESAGQCGPCVLGLPELTERFGALVDGHRSGRQLRRITELAVSIRGRGACAHPDGAVQLAETALEVFGAEVRSHRRRGSCPGRRCRATSGLPLPSGPSVRATAVLAR
jgi:NADH:ubiquinone oxidoreductase subunit F (NADH-binding)